MTSLVSCPHLLLTATLALAVAGQAAAQWSNDPSVNNLFADTTRGDGDARAYVQHSGSGGLYAYRDALDRLVVRRISADGVPDPIPPPLDTGLGSEFEIVGVKTAHGGAIFAYLKGTRIWGFAVNVIGGTILGPAPLSSTNAVCLEGPAICGDGLQGAMIGWQEWGSSQQEVRVARIQYLSGTSWQFSFNNTVYTAPSTDALRSVRVAPLTAPWGAVVAWIADGAGGLVRAQTARIHAGGSVTDSGADVVSPSPVATDMELKIASNPQTRDAFYTMYLKQGTASGLRTLITQRITSAGATPLGPAGYLTFQGSLVQQYGVGEDPFALAAKGDGGFVCVANRQQSSGITKLMLKFVDAQLNVVTCEVTSTAALHEQPDLFVTGDHAIVVWQKRISTSPITYWIYAQRVDLTNIVEYRTWNNQSDFLVSDRFATQWSPVIHERESCKWLVSFVNNTHSPANAGYGQLITHNADNGEALGFEPCSGPFGASWIPFGTSCAGTNGLVSMACNNQPHLGILFQMQLDNLPPAGIHFFILSVRPPISLGLDPLGAVGCLQQVQTDVTVLGLTNAAGTGILDQPIPNDPAWIGLSLYGQGAAVDPGANALGLTTTNGIRARIGQ